MRKFKDEQKLELVPYKAMWHALDWAVEHECESVENFLIAVCVTARGTRGER